MNPSDRTACRAIITALAVLVLTGCTSRTPTEGFERVHSGVFVSPGLADQLDVVEVASRGPSGTEPIHVEALVRSTLTTTRQVEYRTLFSPSRAADGPWKILFLESDQEAVLADSAYDAMARRWRIEIRPAP